MAMYEYITNEGYRLLQRMLMGEVQIDFTRVEMGDGYPQESDLKKVTALSAVVVSLDVDSVIQQENNTISVAAVFSNEKMEKGFYFREKGLYAKGLDGSGTEQEILFSYANARDTANYIDPPTVELVEKKIISHCTQCQKADGQINIVVKSGIYVEKKELDDLKDLLREHLVDYNNPHKGTKKQLGLDKVDNTSDADKPVSTLQKQAIDNSKTADSATGENPTATNSTDGNLIYLKNSGYTEQDGTPTPDAPIHIDGLGDKGYFDGELVQGYYNYGVGDTVSFVSSANVVCNTNIIHCNGGDSVALQYENSATLRVIFADENMKSLASESIDDIQITMVAPLQTKYLLFVIGGDNITPSTAKHICVTINGQYAVRVKTCGKNLLKVEPKTVTANNCTFTFNEDGSITANGTNPNNWIANTIVDTIKLKAGTYTMSQNVTGTTNPYLYVVINGEWHTLVSYKSKTFTLTEDTEVIVHVGVYNKATVTNATIYPQLELGEVATDYEPYTETQALIPISSTLYDEDYIEVYADGSGQIVRENGSYTANSASGWNIENTGTSRTRLRNNTAVVGKAIGSVKAWDTTIGKCNQLVSATPQNTWSGDIDNCFAIDDSGFLYVYSSSLQTIESFTTQVTNNPMTFLYKLATPTTEPLTAEQIAEFKKLQTFKEVTHINADGEVTVRYYCNNDSGDTVGMLHEMVEDIEGEVAELPDKYADKAIYGDDEVSYGRKVDSSVGLGSFAFGNNVTASTDCAHAEGTDTTASGLNSHAEGFWTTASGSYSHAEGNSTTASGSSSHAEGNSTTAFGSSSHAEGQGTKALGNSSHAEGRATQALENQHAQGHYNDTSLATMNSSSGASSGTAFVIGNGSVNTASNAFRITGNGEAIGKASFASTGADYAEYFEWRDGNPDNEDRVGCFVTFAEGNLIKKATAGDYVLGIVSGMPCVIGNNDECWMKQFELDEWGRYIYETHSEINEETGEEKEYTFYKVNPDYDSSKEYIHRKERPEWSAVGMIGVLSVYDDGTCQVNGYCKCTNGGIATACERGIDTYRVIARVTDNIVKIVLKS